MSDLASLIKSLESCGFSNEEAKAKAEAELERAERERERACEFFVYFMWFCFIIELFRQLGAGEDQIGTDQTIEK